LVFVPKLIALSEKIITFKVLISYQT